jgi:hypothetical protein
MFIFPNYTTVDYLTFIVFAIAAFMVISLILWHVLYRFDIVQRNVSNRMFTINMALIILAWILSFFTL